MSQPTHQLDYAGPNTRNPAISAMAVLSMLLSIVEMPCVSGPIAKGLHLVDHLSFATCWLLLISPAIVLAVIALMRIKQSEGKLTGEEYCYFAFTFSGLWIALLAVGWWLFHDLAIGPRN